ncbi:ty3-gypsy retrotransposon protein [Cucumis melo var. makuwa]|uniref:Ty3-gypsy retrotransposon protein n=1 Tax=Cucumis melo var. makuwa TaxID=1194695 RepID=A0A5A7UXX0_CUCMM|nr:ty3-gypsy retrotransposon protein [Cucumis melo var. makuwa]TYK16247.1 ty3-gypsy retrotransposon protein [Cucumis melo var. makuwa]
MVELKNLEVSEETEIELKTMMGFVAKGTMKLKGLVKGKEVIVLVDSGATHDFIHQAVVEEVNIIIEKDTTFGVTIENGTNRRGRGLCKRVELKLPELIIVADFLVIELGKVDIILGMQWLCTTGSMRVHWLTLTMTFMVGEKQITLKGDPLLIKAECSLKTIQKTWEEEDQGSLLEL